jgi:hypothetical protein
MTWTSAESESATLIHTLLAMRSWTHGGVAQRVLGGMTGDAVAFIEIPFLAS